MKPINTLYTAAIGFFLCLLFGLAFRQCENSLEQSDFLDLVGEHINLSRSHEASTRKHLIRCEKERYQYKMQVTYMREQLGLDRKIERGSNDQRRTVEDE